MKLISQTKEAWIPEWNGNRNLPKSEQVIVHLSYPTIEQKENISNIEYIRGKDGDVTAFKIKYNTEYLLTNHVPKIENLVDEVDGKERAIKNGADLLNSKNRGVQQLVQKIVARLTSADDIDEDTVKN